MRCRNTILDLCWYFFRCKTEASNDISSEGGREDHSYLVGWASSKPVSSSFRRIAGGPKAKQLHWRKLLPDFEPDSGRAPMGRREAPFVHSDTPSATRKRELREEAKSAYLTIESQVKVAQRRARKGVTNPAKTEVLSRFRTRKAPTAMGDRVRFVRPGPRRNAVEGRGVVLCLPDKNKRFVAIDRSADQRKGKALSLIDVVPVEDAWCEQLRE